MIIKIEVSNNIIEIPLTINKFKDIQLNTILYEYTDSIINLLSVPNQEFIITIIDNNIILNRKQYITPEIISIQIIDNILKHNININDLILDLFLELNHYDIQLDKNNAEIKNVFLNNSKIDLKQFLDTTYQNSNKKYRKIILNNKNFILKDTNG